MHDKAYVPHEAHAVPAVFKKCPALQADTTVAEFISDAAAEFVTPVKQSPVYGAKTYFAETHLIEIETLVH